MANQIKRSKSVPSSNSSKVSQNNTPADLNKDYTSPEAARQFIAAAMRVLGEKECLASSWIDPCAGGRALSAAAVEQNWKVTEFDICVDEDDAAAVKHVNQADMYDEGAVAWPRKRFEGGYWGTIINPPFNAPKGISSPWNNAFCKKSRLAAQCIKRCFQMGSQVVVAIVPNIANSYDWQRDLHSDCALIHVEKLPYGSFTRKGAKKARNVNCSVQIWMTKEILKRRKLKLKDKARKKKEAGEHPDFEMLGWDLKEDGVQIPTEWTWAIQKSCSVVKGAPLQIINLKRAGHVIKICTGKNGSESASQFHLVKPNPSKSRIVDKVIKGICPEKLRKVGLGRSTTSICSISQMAIVEEYVRDLPGDSRTG